MNLARIERAEIEGVMKMLGQKKYRLGYLIDGECCGNFGRRFFSEEDAKKENEELKNRGLVWEPLA